MVDNVALQVKPIEIQPNTNFANSLLAASQIKNANTQNQLAEFGLQQKQGEQNALAEYSRLKQSGVPNPENALAQFPEAQARQVGIEGGIQENIRKKTEDALLNKGRAAASVLALPPEQREAAYHEQLDSLLKNGHMNSLEYQAAKSKPVSEQGLLQVVYRALPVEHALTQRNKEQDRTDLNDAWKALPGQLQPPAAVAPPVAGGTILSAPGMPDATTPTALLAPPGPAPIAPGAAPAVPPPTAGAAPVKAPIAPLPERAPMDPYAKAIVNIMRQPGASEGLRAGLKSVLDQHLKNSEPTNPLKEYRVAQQQGYAGTFTDWERENKAAGRNQITIDQRGETKLSEELGKGLAKQFNEQAADGVAAGDERTLIGRLGSLLEQSGTGTNVAFTQFVRNWTGVPLGKNAGLAEASNAIIKYLTPRMRVPGTGASSDKDVAIFAEALPSLLSTPDGKRIVVETLGGAAQARILRGDIAQSVQTGEKTAKEAIAEMRKIGDPFASFRAWQEGQAGGGGGTPNPATPPAIPAQPAGTPPPSLPVAKTKAEYDALLPGPFIGMDGRRYTKPPAPTGSP